MRPILRPAACAPEPDDCGMGIFLVVTQRLPVVDLHLGRPVLHGGATARRAGRVGSRRNHGLLAEDADAGGLQGGQILVARQGGGSNGREKNGGENEFLFRVHVQSPVVKVLVGRVYVVGWSFSGFQVLVALLYRPALDDTDVTGRSFTDESQDLAESLRWFHLSVSAG